MNLFDMLIRRSRPQEQSDSSSSSGGVTPVLPTDYVRRYELTANLKDSKHSTNTDYDLTKPSYASVSYGTEDGITGCKVTGSCLYNTWTTGLSTTNGFCMSLWAKCAASPASSANPNCLANISQYWTSNSWYIGYRNGCWCGGTAKSSTAQIIQSTTAVDTSWHCIALNWNKSDAQVELWLDGVLQGVITGVSSLTITNKGVTVNAGEASHGASPDGKPDVNVRYRDITVFARSLSEAEILGLAQEH